MHLRRVTITGQTHLVGCTPTVVYGSDLHSTYLLYAERSYGAPSARAGYGSEMGYCQFRHVQPFPGKAFVRFQLRGKLAGRWRTERPDSTHCATALLDGWTNIAYC